MSFGFKLDLGEDVFDIDVGSGDWSFFSGTGTGSQSNSEACLNVHLDFTEDDSGVDDYNLLSPVVQEIRKGILNSPQRDFVKKADDLRICQKLGNGVCGVVKKVEHIPSKRMLACKCVSLGKEEKLSQFAQELKILLRLNHSNVVKLLGATLHSEEYQCLLIMEYMDFGSLEDVLERNFETNGPLPEELCASVTKDLLSGLAYLHKNNVLHRDLKPANVLLNSKFTVKLADFGLGKALEHAHEKAMTVVGTACYMSPERIAGRMYSFKSDIWALGHTIYTLANGKPFFNPNQAPIALSAHICSGEKPTLSTKFSRYFRSFLCCTTDLEANRRYSLARLKLHPFVMDLEDSKHLWHTFLQCQN